MLLKDAIDSNKLYLNYLILRKKELLDILEVRKIDESIKNQNQRYGSIL